MSPGPGRQAGAGSSVHQAAAEGYLKGSEGVLQHARRPALRPGPATQYSTHSSLVKQARTPVTQWKAPDAVIVPASRPAAYLEHACELAALLPCHLIVLCSREAHAEEVLALPAAQRCRLTAADLPAAYSLPRLWPQSPTAELEASGALPGHAARDTGIKRNAGLAVARMLDWGSIFFLDDDVTVMTGVLGRTVAALRRDQMHCTGMRVTYFPDNSVACHALRATGQQQAVMASGGALAVRSPGTGFFPGIYNEDWLFMYPAITAGRLGAHGSAVQFAYDPFDNPGRARQQEFGDVIAEGLYSLLHLGRGPYHAGAAWWEEFITARAELLSMVSSKAQDAPAEMREPLLLSMKAAQEVLAEITPGLCAEYVQAWYTGIRSWRTAMARCEPARTIAEALGRLGLEAAA